MIPRTLFSAEHDDFRRSFRRFVDNEIVPHHSRFEEQQHIDRELWNRAGELGFLCATMPEQYGGADADRLYSVVMIEELAHAGTTGPGFYLHSDIVANYINNFGTDAQKRRWLPRMASGELVAAIAMTEPGTGSDLQAVRTAAVSDGDHYLVSGANTFITNGYLCDLVVVVVKTGDVRGGAGNISLLVVEQGAPGFSKGRPLKKIGMKAQDTCELFFDNVRVPKSNRLGDEGSGFKALMQELAWERLILAITAIADAETALLHTIEYTKSRNVFGQPVAGYQNTRFKLAEMKGELAIGRVYVDRCIELALKRELGADDAAIAKFWCTELQGRVIDQCLQFFGGSGYMSEYPIVRAYIDCRAQRIYGGTNEIMREVVARTL